MTERNATATADSLATGPTAHLIEDYADGMSLSFFLSFPTGNLLLVLSFFLSFQKGICFWSLTFFLIVEAMNAKRELFGFKRTQQISHQSAIAIANAAQAFGQQDDITVVSVVVERAKAAVSALKTASPVAMQTAESF